MATACLTVRARALFIPYGTGFLLGFLSNDTVTFGGVPITNVTFGQAVYMASFFSQVPIDGILGLAFPDIAADGVVPVLDMMWAQGLISQFMFSTYLSSTPNDNSSMLFLGGVDPAYFSGPIHWSPVILPSYWVVGMRNVTIGPGASHVCSPHCPAVIDTGTSILAFPPHVGNPILKAIGTVNADCSNIASLPTIDFALDGAVLSLEPEYYGASESIACRMHTLTRRTPPKSSWPTTRASWALRCRLSCGRSPSWATPSCASTTPSLTATLPSSAPTTRRRRFSRASVSRSPIRPPHRVGLVL